MTIESEGVAGRGFASVNLESKSAGIKTEDQLYDYVRGRLSDKGRTYVFIDEPQRIEGWQDAVNAMRVDFVATKDGRVLYVQATDEMLASCPSEVDTRQPREDRGREAGFLRHGHRRLRGGVFG